jgi:hypothetical protein
MLDPQEEKRFEELRGMCRELKVPAPPEIMIGLQVHENGVLTFDDVQRGHSWTRNFYNILFGIAASSGGDASGVFGAGYMSAKRSTGTIDSIASYSPATATVTGGCTNAGNNSYIYGIVVGTDDTAFSSEQFNLAALVNHGNSAAQLYYQAMAIATVAYTGGAKTWKATLRRIFNNNSGGSITIKEVGLGFYGYGYAAGLLYYMLERSVLSPTVAVANGAQLTVTYEISMDFSAID